MFKNKILRAEYGRKVKEDFEIPQIAVVHQVIIFSNQLRCNYASNNSTIYECEQHEDFILIENLQIQLTGDAIILQLYWFLLNNHSTLYIFLSIARFCSHLLMRNIIRIASKIRVLMPVKRLKIRLCSSVQPSTNLPRTNPETKPMKVKEMNPKPNAITNLKSSYSLSLSNCFLLLNPSI